MYFSDDLLDKWHLWNTERFKLPTSKSSAELVQEGILTKEEVDFIISNYPELRNHWLARHSEREEARFLRLQSEGFAT